MKTRFDRPVPFDIGPLYSAGDKAEPPKMWTDGIDFTTASANSISISLTKETDDIIRDCLNKFLGNTDWALDDLRGRLFCLIPPDKSCRTFYIDQTPLVTFYPSELQVENNIMKVNQKYKILIDSEKKSE